MSEQETIPDENADQVSNPIETLTQPGAILAAARQELKLTVEGVANELHLRPSVVMDIEGENYEEFSSDVFLKGYFRSYCRLVGLHEARMVELLDKQLKNLVEQKLSSEKAESDAQRKENQKQLFKQAGIFIVVIILCALMVVSLTDDTSFGQKEEIPGPDISEGVVTEAFEGKADAQTVMVDSLPETERRLSGDTGQDEPAQSSSDEGALDLSDKPLFEEDTNAKLTNASETQLADNTLVVPEPAELQAQPLGLEINFKGECWFELYANNGRRITAGLKQAGVNYSYEGERPVRLVLGNSAAAEVYTDGSLLDLSVYARPSGRAELTIE
jgi:cytoskeletal protein RodZ